MTEMLKSLNISVTSALILDDAQCQRHRAVYYQRSESSFANREQQRLLYAGAYPILVPVADQKRLTCPRITPAGEVKASPECFNQVPLSLQ